MEKIGFLICWLACVFGIFHALGLATQVQPPTVPQPEVNQNGPLL